MAAELIRERYWIQSVVDQFQRYLAWFERHQEKKAEKTKLASNVLSSVSTAVAFVPVVGTALSIAITLADVGIQLKRGREAMAELAAAGAQIDAGLIALSAIEAYEVTAHDLLEAQLALAIERENLVTLLEIYEGKPDTSAARVAPVQQADQVLRQLRPRTSPLLLGAVVIGGALLLLLRRRR